MNKDKLLKNRNYWLNCHDDSLFYAVLLFGALGLGAYVSGLDFGLQLLLGINFCLIVLALIKRQMNKATPS